MRFVSHKQLVSYRENILNKPVFCCIGNKIWENRLRENTRAANCSLRREQLLFVSFWVLVFNVKPKCKCFIVCVHTRRILMVSLVVLDCLNGQITHLEPLMIRTRTKAALIKCQVNSATFKSNALHWYKAPPKGALQRLMYFEAGSKTPKKDPDAPRKISGSVNDAEKDVVTLTLTITRLELSDEGSYYCALWSEDNTVLTMRGNHGKNLLSSSKRFYLEQQQQGGDIRHILTVMLLLVLNI